MKIGTLATMVAILLIGFPIASMAGVAPDTDNDTVPDVLDNCVTVPNAGSLDCDTDQDGYGNACDGDFDNSFGTDGADFNPTFLADFQVGTDSGVGTDMNCDTVVDGSDFNPLFLDNFGAGSPGPSGLGCAGTVPCP